MVKDGSDGKVSNQLSSLQDRVFAVFGPALSASLIEYAKFVSEIDTDFVIFMARKSVRLIDLLVLAGCQAPSRNFTYQYVLDQDRARFEGKTVTLVDDTLILGTTLGRAKRDLLAAGASRVDTVVFAVDENYWDQKLIQPDKYFVKLKHDSLLSFCAAEVQAFKQFRIPYLTDFPIVEDIRLTPSRLAKMHLLPSWDIHSLQGSKAVERETSIFTALPEDLRISRVRGIAFGSGWSR